MGTKTLIENGVLTVVTDGEPPLIIDPAELPDNIVAYAALHGLKQRIVDARAGVKDDAEAAAIMRGLYDHIRDTGEWTTRGIGLGGGSDGLLLRAVIEVYGVAREAAKAHLATVPKATQTAMRESDELRPTIERMRKEKAPKVATATVADALAGLRRL